MNDIELFDKPGIVITNDAVYKTTKVKKWIKKNNPKEYSIKYLDVDTSDFKEVEYQLQKMVNDIKGISTKEKKVEQEDEVDYEYKLRVKYNAVLCSHTKEGLEKLIESHKDWLLE